MRDLLILAIHLLVTVAKLLRPGGARTVAAESLLLKHQLLISNRARQRARVGKILNAIETTAFSARMHGRELP